MKGNNLKRFGVILICAGFAGCHSNSVKDIDGNKYKTIHIGEQVWMAEDLKTTKYNDGSAIPLVNDYDKWSKLITEGFCWYNNDNTDKRANIALYNWYSVATNKLCPKGWHVPTDAEWEALGIFLGGPPVAGGKMKEKGFGHWKEPNILATNESGFTALPGGFRSFNGSFSYIGKSGYWWSSTEYSGTNSFFFNLRYKYSDLYRYIADKPNGFCVRCLLDK